MSGVSMRSPRLALWLLQRRRAVGGGAVSNFFSVSEIFGMSNAFVLAARAALSLRLGLLAPMLVSGLCSARPAPAAEALPAAAPVTLWAPPVREWPTREPSAGRHWYGWQTLATDGAGLALLIAARQAAGPHERYGPLAEGLAYSGFTSLLIGAPTVHWAHGRLGTGFASLALRSGVPAVSYYLLSHPGSCEGECSQQLLSTLTAVLILPAPILIDAIWLAREKPEPGSAATHALERLRFYPSIALERRHFAATLELAW